MNKRRIVFITLLLSMSISLIACGTKNNKSKHPTQKDTTTSTTATTKAESIYTGKPIKGEGYILHGKNVRFVVDKNGEKLGEFSVRDINKIYEENGMDPEDIYELKIYDGILYVNYYDSFDSIYAIDLNSGKSQKLATLDKDTRDLYSHGYFDIYNGKIYIGVSSYDENTPFKEYVFTINDDFTYTPAQSKFDKVIASAKDYKFIVNLDAYNGYGSLARIFDDVGFVLAENKNDIIKIFPDGKKENVTEIEGEVYAYNKDCMVYYDYSNIYSVNFDDGKKTSVLTITDNIDKYANIYANNKIYYAVEKHTDNHPTFLSIHELDLTTKSDCEIYTANLEHGYYTFEMHENTIFCKHIIDDEYRWIRIDNNDGVYQAIDIDCPAEKVYALTYGKLVYNYKESVCPYCGTIVGTTSSTAFQLDDKYSKHAASINEKISEHLACTLDFMPTSKDKCEQFHEEIKDKKTFCNSNDSSVEDVLILNNQFLFIDCSFYEYGSGAAHGMVNDKQLIFDLNTGEELNPANFYPGTKDDLDELVAKKVEEDFNRNPNKYFAEDAQGAKCNALESVGYYSISEAPIFFKEDKIIYKFAPYAVGPWASGFIEIELSYEEFCGKKTLTQVD
ncbi:MAG: DUF3298 domain-containing protein [Pseudobutyrivibrio sp.]|nr:DUF3298 domain-containing protein [Pseudobutyrivibrio sp.]